MMIVIASFIMLYIAILIYCNLVAYYYLLISVIIIMI